MADNNNHKHTPNANGNYYSNKNNKGGHPYNNYNKYNHKQQKGNNNRQQNNAQSNKTANIGWLFYRDYFRGIEGKNADDLKEHFLQKNKEIESSIYADVYKKISNPFNKNNLKGYATFDLEVCPPGLLIGSGMLHGVPGEGDFQLGLQFDHTSGLPIIPGSSIKGVLRSMFPELNKKKDDKGNIIYNHDNNRINYIIEKLIELKELNLSESDINKLKELITDNSTPHPIENLTQRLFNHEVCEETGVKFPVFMDALIVIKDGHDGKILGSDYITPHHDAFKDPVPIKFLKVLPGVKFKFFFSIPSSITIEELELNQGNIVELFKSILQDVGIGAKTNVGYGHLK